MIMVISRTQDDPSDMCVRSCVNLGAFPRLVWILSSVPPSAESVIWQSRSGTIGTTSKYKPWYATWLHSLGRSHCESWLAILITKVAQFRLVDYCNLAIFGRFLLAHYTHYLCWSSSWSCQISAILVIPPVGPAVHLVPGQAAIRSVISYFNCPLVIQHSYRKSPFLTG